MSKINNYSPNVLKPIFLALALLLALALPIVFAPMQANIFVSEAHAGVVLPGRDDEKPEPVRREDDFANFLTQTQDDNNPNTQQALSTHASTLETAVRLQEEQVRSNVLLHSTGAAYSPVQIAQLNTSIVNVTLANPALTEVAVDLATGGTGGVSVSTGDGDGGGTVSTADGDGNQDQKTYSEKMAEAAGYLEDKNYTAAAEAYMKIAEDENSIANEKRRVFQSTGGEQYATSYAYGNAAGVYEKAGDAYVQAGDFAKAELAYEKAANAYANANKFNEITTTHDKRMAIAQAKANSAAEGKAYDPSSAPTPGGTGGTNTASSTVSTGANPIEGLSLKDLSLIQSVALDPSQHPNVSEESIIFAQALIDMPSFKEIQPISTLTTQTIAHAPSSVSTQTGMSAGSPADEDALIAQFVSKFVDEVFGSPQVVSGWSVFLTPYGNFSSSTNGSSHGDTYGLSGGITHIFNEKFSLGMHFDLGSSHSYATSLSTESRTFTGSLGINANYKFTPEWYVGASITGSLSNTYNDYKTTSVAGSHDANNNHGGSSLSIGLNTGYIVQLNENHALIPEVGLSYVYSHTAANDIKWNNGGSGLNMYNDATNYDALYGNMALRWLGTFEIDENSTLKPFVSVGLRQNLSGHPMQSSMKYNGTRYNNEATPDLTTFTTTAGIEWVWNNFSVNLNYNGAYGVEKVNHGGGITFGYSF